MALGLRGVLADTRPLANPHFRRLFVANIITVVGAQLTVVSVPAQIYADTGSSGYVGLTGLFGLVPLVVFGLYGGALADHVDKRTLLLVSTCGLITTSGLFAIQAFAGNTNVWVLLGLFAVQQGFFAMNQPARTSLLPALLGGHLLPAANALNMTVLSFGGIAGPLVAGALIPLTGFSWLYLVDTATLLATLYAVVRLPSLQASAAGRSPGLRSVVDGLVHLAGQPVLMMSFVVDLIAMIFGMPRALFPELAHTSFGGPAAGGPAFALLFAAIPAGSVLGGVFSGWVSGVRRQGRAVVLAVAVWGLGVFVFGICALLAPGSPALALALGVTALAVAGGADIVSAAFRQSILLGAAAEQVRGRLQGIFIVVVAGGPRIADVLHGGAADLVGPPHGAALTTAVGGIAVVALLALTGALGRSFWHYTPRRDPAGRPAA